MIIDTKDKRVMSSLEEVILSQELRRLDDVQPAPDKILVIGKAVFTSILNKNHRGEDQWCWLYTPERTLKDTLL